MKKTIIITLLAAVSAFGQGDPFGALRELDAQTNKLYNAEPPLDNTEFRSCEEIGAIRFGVEPFTGREAIYHLMNNDTALDFVQEYPDYRQTAEDALSCWQQTVAHIERERDSLDKKERKAFLKEKSGESRVRRKTALYHAKQAIGNYKKFLSDTQSVD